LSIFDEKITPEVLQKAGLVKRLPVKILAGRNPNFSKILILSEFFKYS
jgi:hypothetical protein